MILDQKVNIIRVVMVMTLVIATVHNLGTDVLLTVTIKTIIIKMTSININNSNNNNIIVRDDDDDNGNNFDDEWSSNNRSVGDTANPTS